MKFSELPPATILIFRYLASRLPWGGKMVGQFVRMNISTGIQPEFLIRLNQGCFYRLIKEIDKYAFPDQIEKELAFYRGNLSSYGYNTIQKTSFLSISDRCGVIFESLIAMRKYDFILNDGLLNSLKVKIEGAQEFIVKQKGKGVSAAVGKVNAALNELEAQNGKGINSDAYLILKGAFETLVAQIEVASF